MKGENMRNILIFSLITIVIVTLSYFSFKRVTDDLQDSLAELQDLEVSVVNMTGRVNDLQNSVNVVVEEVENLNKSKSWTTNKLRNLEIFAEVMDTEAKNLRADLADLHLSIEALASKTESEFEVLSSRIEAEIVSENEALADQEIETPYEVSNEVDKVVAEPVACPQPVKNRSYSYFIQNVSLKKSVAFRVIYDLKDGEVYNVEFESNPPTNLRRPTIRYLNSLYFADATAQNCSIPFKINVD
jgi:predicted nuclease with TOPRIM domain